MYDIMVDEGREREREVYLEMKYLQRREEKTEAEVNDW